MPPKSAQHSLQLEYERARDATQGFEPTGSDGFIRYLEHGFPSSLVRWHYHEEYELHLILETSGKVFVGDYVGQFAPGHLVLTGPRVPHNWVPMDTPQQIAEPAGCDLLTISPDLLAQLAASSAPLPRRLGVPGAAAVARTRLRLNEAAFRLALNDDAMASEKLADGIRGFCIDSALLEQMIVERIGLCKKV